MGRDLDYDLKEMYSKVSATGHFYKNGELLYTGSIIPAYVGLHTGMKPHKFGISINMRNDNGLEDKIK